MMLGHAVETLLNIFLTLSGFVTADINISPLFGWRIGDRRRTDISFAALKSLLRGRDESGRPRGVILDRRSTDMHNSFLLSNFVNFSGSSLYFSSLVPTQLMPLSSPFLHSSITRLFLVDSSSSIVSLDSTSDSFILDGSPFRLN